MGSVWKNKGTRSKPWQARPHNPYMKPGMRREPSKTFETKRQAVVWVEQEERRIALDFAGLDSAERGRAARQVTMREQADRFLETFTKRSKASKASHIDYVLDVLGADRAVTSPTRGDLRRFVAHMATTPTARTGKVLASQTRCDRLRAAYDIFQSAVDDEVRPDNPAAGMSVEWTDEAAPPRWLTDTEFGRLIWHTPQWARLTFQVCRFAGLRIGEASALAWGDLVLDTDEHGWGLVHVRQHWTRDPGGGAVIGPGTKNGRSREGAVRPELVGLLRADLEHWAWGPGDLITFDPRRPARQITPHDMGDVFRRAWKAAKLPDPRATTHDLRASFARELREAGVSDDVTSDCMGHWTRPVLRRYAGTLDGWQQGAALRERGIGVVRPAA